MAGQQPWEMNWSAQPAAPAAASGNPWEVDWNTKKPADFTAGETAADIAKAAGTGLVRGVVGFAGLPGDVTQLAVKGAEKVLPAPSEAAPDEADQHLGWLDRTFPNAMKRIREEHERFQKLPSAQVGSGDVPGSYEPPTTAQLMQSLENVTGVKLPEAQTTPGKFTQTVAQFAPGAAALGPEKGIQGAVSNFGKLAALPGMASEYLGQKTEGTWLEPYARLIGAVGGAGVGAGVSKGAEAVANRAAASQAATEAGGNVSPAALAKVAKNYQADALTPEAVAARQQDLGPEAMMLDLGRQLQGRAEAIASQPGRGQNKVLDAVEERVHGRDQFGNINEAFGAATAQRTKDTLDQVMGPSPDIVATKNHINDVVDNVAAPLYKNVMDANPVVQVPASITSRPVVAQAMKDAEQLAKNHGENITGTKETKTILQGPGYHIAEDVSNPAQTSLRYWDYVKKALDSRINGMMRSGGIQELDSAGKADLGGLMAAKTALVNHLDNLTGGAYAMARKASATKFDVNEAMDFGRSSLNTRLLPEELGEHMQGMSLPEQAAVKAGMRREVDRIIDTARNDGAAARALLDTNQNRQKIALVFGEDAANAVDQRIAAETRFQTAANKIAANSRTGVRTQLVKDTEAPNLAGPPVANVGGLALAGLRRGREYLGDMSLERTREGIADLLTRQGQDIPTLARILSGYTAAKAANAPASVGRQAGSLANILASQAPNWFLTLPKQSPQ